MSVTHGPPTLGVDGVTTIAVGIQVKGTYAQVMDYQTRLAALQRLVVVTGVQFATTSDTGTATGKLGGRRWIHRAVQRWHGAQRGDHRPDVRVAGRHIDVDRNGRLDCVLVGNRRNRNAGSQLLGAEQQLEGATGPREIRGPCEPGVRGLGCRTIEGLSPDIRPEHACCAS